jgi:uncharacterized membrane protein YhaH (DUF805 family)
MFCGQCATANPDSNRFCISCGSPIQSVETPSSSLAPAQYTQQPNVSQQSNQTTAASGLAPRKMSFVDAIKYCLTNYANFKGRASRSEYWYFYLFGILALFVAVLLAPILYYIAGLALLVPYIAVGTRRLHDTGRSGAHLLWTLIPLVGAILVLVWLCTEGDKTVNKYGPPW